MLYLVGKLEKAFLSPSGTRKDGTKYDSAGRLQILEDEPMNNGETRLKLHNMNCPPEQVQFYQTLVGQRCVFPVRVYRDNCILTDKAESMTDFAFP